ncbi:hypothetical protein, partial [Heyndrickxia coagulans]|uniref:hypothetical protein n=1 Tax=Heyndrickxia coagulans TaxID=1398 RepID=UPI00214DB595
LSQLRCAKGSMNDVHNMPSISAKELELKCRPEALLTDRSGQGSEETVQEEVIKWRNYSKIVTTGEKTTTLFV